MNRCISLSTYQREKSFTPCAGSDPYLSLVAPLAKKAHPLETALPTPEGCEDGAVLSHRFILPAYIITTPIELYHPFQQKGVPFPRKYVECAQGLSPPLARLDGEYGSQPLVK